MYSRNIYVELSGSGCLPDAVDFSVMKRLFFFLTLTLLLHGQHARGQDDVQFLNVTSDHSPVSYSLADAPTITFDNDQMVIQTTSGTVTTPLQNVQKWTFSVANVMVHDVNTDGKIDISDAFFINNFILGKPNPQFESEAADVDGDGAVTIIDVTRIIYLVTGIH